MKFGLHYQLPCVGSQSPVRRYRDTLEQATSAEALGFESVWPVEQHFNADLSILPSPLLLLAALAERTRTLRLGVAIVLLPLSHPLRVAEDVATLDVLSDGRVEFGIGRGSIPTHFTGFGVAQAESRERMLESLDLILQAWTSERVSFSGRFWQVENLAVVPKPVQRPHPPVHVAANSADTFALMGQMGYPICVASQVNPFHKIREYLDVYRQARAAAGHPDRGGEDVSVLMPLYVGDSPAQIRRELEPSITRWLRTIATLYAPYGRGGEPGTKRLQEVLERVRRLTYEQVCENMAVFATPGECVERLTRFRQEFRMGRVICWFNPGGLVPHDRVMRSMELFAARVMPHCNAGAGG
ncbi:MAG: LLM class flavin-dependent oxidoreductase [Thermodesulfobacteriota bacterium]|jgi:alkanesulfonate monooxygenase SsuD/methylene tetrahydromethanopterin reductase-like flavin-dependent oxidoreductase (luciferase family)